MKKKRNTKSNGRTGKGPHFDKRQREVESIDMREDRNLPADERGKTDYHTGKPNDWRWYAASPQLIADYASYPFGTPVGTKTWTGSVLDDNAVPGVMCLQFVPTIGAASQESDPINVAMRKLYSYVRYQNSGAKNYDAPDLMLYMLAVDSCYMYFSWMKRIYGVAVRDYTPFNRYYPTALVQAMGANFSDIMDNIVKLRGYINQYAFKLTQLFIPNSMSFMARHTWMCEGIYTDSTSTKAQTYMFNPAAFYQFTLDSNGVGSCVYKDLGSQMTVSQIISFGEALLNPLIANEDFGIMSGDILKAFGEGGIVKPAPITEEYQVLPVYDQEVLSQFENATILNCSVLSSGVTQTTAVGTGYLQSSAQLYLSIPAPSDLAFTASGDYTQIATNIQQAMGSRRVVNFHHDAVTPAEVMVATRLTNILYSVGTPAYSASSNELTITCTCDTFGTEIITKGTIYRYAESNGSWGMTTIPIVPLIADIASEGQPVGSLNSSLRKNTLLSALSTFDWHPQVWLSSFYFNGTKVMGSPNVQTMLDFDNYTIIDSANLRQMMLAATLSEFTVPMIG